MSREQVQRELRLIWMTVLDVPEINDTDDFFDLGGDSLVAARMTSLARKAEVPLGAGDLLKHSRFTDLVTVVHGKMADAPR
jgi:mycobactin peptide synthetase MbtE